MLECGSFEVRGQHMGGNSVLPQCKFCNWSQVLKLGSRSHYWLSNISGVLYRSSVGPCPTVFSFCFTLVLTFPYMIAALSCTSYRCLHTLSWLPLYSWLKQSLHIRNYFITSDFLHHENHCYDLVPWQVLCEYWVTLTVLLNLVSLWKRCFPPSHTWHN